MSVTKRTIKTRSKAVITVQTRGSLQTGMASYALSPQSGITPEVFVRETVSVG
jgi:hypothetical protein